MPWVTGRHLSKDMERSEDNISESIQKDRDLFVLVLSLHVKNPELSDDVGDGHIWLHNPSIYGSLHFVVNFTRLSCCCKFHDRQLGMERSSLIGRVLCGSVAQERKDLEAWHS